MTKNGEAEFWDVIHNLKLESELLDGRRSNGGSSSIEEEWKDFQKRLENVSLETLKLFARVISKLLIVQFPYLSQRRKKN